VQRRFALYPPRSSDASEGPRLALLPAQFCGPCHPVDGEVQPSWFRFVQAGVGTL